VRGHLRAEDRRGHKRSARALLDHFQTFSRDCGLHAFKFFVTAIKMMMSFIVLSETKPIASPHLPLLRACTGDRRKRNKSITLLSLGRWLSEH